MKRIDALIGLISGEWILDTRSNGGLVILMRTAWISAFVYALAILLAEAANPKATPCFSFEELRERISETVPWLGAIVGAVYAALYARFSSQWQYLAQLYNQLMQVGMDVGKPGFNQVRWNNWRAAFIEDAYSLHLACKPMFAAAINQMLSDPDVLAAYRQSTINAEVHLANMKERFRRHGIQPFES